MNFLNLIKSVKCNETMIFSATDEHGELAPRVGFFHNFKKSDFLVKKWDKKLEDLSPIRNLF